MFRETTIKGFGFATPTFKAVSSKSFSLLTNYITFVPDQIHIIDFGDGNTDCFKVAFDEKEYFLRIFEAEQYERVQQSDNIENWLLEKFNLAPGVMAGYPKFMFDGRCCSLKNYIPVSHIPLTDLSLFRLGEAVKALHIALDSHSDCSIWKSKTDARMDEISELSRLLTVEDADETRFGCVFRADLWSENWARLKKKWPRHATHGDLNLNNILWNGSEIKFLDFEDVPHSFLHPIFDIVLIFERILFCNAKLRKKQIVNLARQFLSGYSFDFNMFNEPTTPAPYELAMGLSVRSLLLLEQNSGPKRKGNN